MISVARKKGFVSSPLSTYKAAVIGSTPTASRLRRRRGCSRPLTRCIAGWPTSQSLSRAGRKRGAGSSSSANRSIYSSPRNREHTSRPRRNSLKDPRGIMRLWKTSWSSLILSFLLTLDPSLVLAPGGTFAPLSISCPDPVERHHNAGPSVSAPITAESLRGRRRPTGPRQPPMGYHTS